MGERLVAENIRFTKSGKRREFLTDVLSGIDGYGPNTVLIIGADGSPRFEPLAEASAQELPDASEDADASTNPGAGDDAAGEASADAPTPTTVDSLPEVPEIATPTTEDTFNDSVLFAEEDEQKEVEVPDDGATATDPLEVQAAAGVDVVAGQVNAPAGSAAAEAQPIAPSDTPPTTPADGSKSVPSKAAESETKTQAAKKTTTGTASTKSTASAATESGAKSGSKPAPKATATKAPTKK